MKKTIIGILLGIVALLGGYGVSQSNIGSYNGFQNLTIKATTTSATINQKVLDVNSSRDYALITNDSDTTVYLYPAYFANYAAASTTLMYNQGIRVNANGGTYEINSDNPYTGQLWLATTTADKKLLIIEK
jgi:hypothetical protein